VAGERDELPSVFGERAERFNDARHKLHQLMQRWDQLLPCESAVLGEDYFDFGCGVRSPKIEIFGWPALSRILNIGLACIIAPGMSE
jgi:hypothetical protein